MTFRVSLCLALLLPTCVLSPMNADAAPRPVDETRGAFQSGGRNVRVQIYAPRGTGRHPAVLVLHSAGGTLLGWKELQRFSKSLAERGMTAFLVRYFDRTGTIMADARAIDRHIPAWINTVGDAVDYAASHPRTNRKKIGVFGYSLGAYLSVAQGSLDPRIDAVAEVAGGVFDPPFPSRMRRMPPILIMHGIADRRVKVSEAYEVAAAAKRFGTRPILQLYPGEEHVLRGAAAADATARTFVFLERNLL